MHSELGSHGIITILANKCEQTILFSLSVLFSAQLHSEILQEVVAQLMRHQRKSAARLAQVVVRCHGFGALKNNVIMM